MAYAAPEVLTGKYSSKIDIFSLGVLIIQLVSRQYPRIERREQQLALACTTHPVLSQLMTECVSYLPSDRPTASGVIATLETIKSNDRYYPLPLVPWLLNLNSSYPYLPDAPRVNEGSMIDNRGHESGVDIGLRVVDLLGVGILARRWVEHQV